tara:strand:- start:2753 stop:3184 length:432 start_codon:yes stop_codon:yes gene_type:complete
MENYNNHDIRIGALSDLDIKVKVNVNYVLTAMKEWNNRNYQSEEDELENKVLAWNILYVETLNNQQSEAFWSDFNYSLMNEDWDTQINFSNCEMVVGKGTEGEEVQLFMNVFEDFFENDMDMGGEWGFNSQEEREEFIKKSSC